MARSAEEILRTVAEGTARVSGEDFFRALALRLSAALGLRYCFLTRCLGSPPTRLATLAFWNGEAFVDNFEYDLAGTPCQGVVAGEACIYPRGIQPLFPDDQDLVDLDAESYAAVPFQSSEGEVIGHLAVLDVAELEEDSIDLSILKIFAARAGAELERLHAKVALEASQRTLRQAQKIESLGVLAGGIAHDFNNLLTSVLGNAEMALSKVDAHSPSHNHLREIITSAQRATTLSHQMLTYAGSGHFRASPIDLSMVIGEMADLLRSSVSKKATLELDLADDLPAIEVDISGLRQIVLNLVVNGSDALATEPGVISVRTGVRQLDRSALAASYLDDDLPSGFYVVLTVRDSGHGLDEETRVRMFDPFFSTRFAGRGLGLAVVLGIVRGHRGAIEVDSGGDQGTAIRVFFPAATAPPPEKTTPLRVTDGAGRTVLIVDDDPGVRTIAGMILRDAGFQAIEVEDGLAAIQLFERQSQEICAVLLDVTMPQLDGRQTVRELRRLQPGVRVVFTSGYSEEEVASQLGRTPEAFVSKPFTAEALTKQLLDTVNDGAEASR
ncbi:MAG: response regulator [Acidobacteriota bacterium]